MQYYSIVDSDPHKQGSELNNIKIYSPSTLKKCSKPIVISSAIYSDNITKQIKENAFKK